jgi:CoA:oxalate CoA-transferase
MLRRERTGCGEYIDVAMFDATLAFMASAVVPYLVTGKKLERTGNVGYSGQPTSAVFVTGDGRQVSLGVVQQAQFEALARALKCERWLADPRFANPDLRRRNSQAMRTELEAVFATQPAAVWERQLSDAGVPCGMVRDVSEAVSLEGLDERGIRLPLHMPGLPDRQNVGIVNAGFKFSQDSPHIDQPPPALGEHSEAILESLGFDASERREILAGNRRKP